MQKKMRLNKIKYSLISVFLICQIAPIFSQDIDNDTAIPPGENDSISVPLEVSPHENDNAPREPASPLTDAQVRRAQYRQRFFSRYELLKKQLDAEPENVAFLIETGRAAQMIAKRLDAIRYYRQAVKIMRRENTYPLEKITDIQRKIIGMLVRINNVNMAIVEFKTLTQMMPDNASIHNEFADFLLHHGFPRRAFLEYKKVLAFNPKDMTVLEKILFLRDEGFISKDEAAGIIGQ